MRLGGDLPTPATPFVGRRDDIDAVLALSARPDGRIVTLVGPAGVGKTRLAIEVAGRAARTRDDGTAFAALAELRDVSGLHAAIAAAIGIAEIGTRPAEDLIVGQLADSDALLVLDNFEQLVEAAPAVASMVERCSRLTLLVTSRRALGVQGERCYHVEPLPGSDAIALLIARVERADSRFALSDADAPVAAAICTRLDGLPLAIELASARARVLSLTAILAALDERLALLTRGDRDLPARHQTMRAAIAWSYELLDPSAAGLLRRLGVCVGGASFECVVAIASDLGCDRVGALDTLGELVEHSLVERSATQEPRFRLLEVVREFALDELDRASETERTRRVLAGHLVAQAEEAARHLSGTEQLAALELLYRDRANFAESIRWAIAEGDADLALRMCLSLRFLWYVRGPLTEGRALFRDAMAMPGATTELRTRAFVEASALARHSGDFDEALRLASAGLDLAREQADPAMLASALLQHAFVLHLRGEFAQARVELEECATLRHALDDRIGSALALHHLGLVAYLGDGEAGLAWELQVRCLALFRELGNERHVATALILMGELARSRGERDVSRELFAEAVGYLQRLQDAPLLIHALHHLAELAADERRLNRAVRLLGAAEGLERSSGAAPWPAVAAAKERWLPAAVTELGRRRLASLRAAGAELDLATALKLAAALEDTGGSDPLTPREREIAGLVAEGLSNRAIAERLVVSERTVDGHVTHVLTKLGFRSRAQIATWVATNGT